jgi:tetratricopeptide (TPR) repeat protein
MNTKRVFSTGCLLALIATSGCAGLQVAQQTRAGRLALQTGRPNEAVAHLMQAAELDPNYTLPYTVRNGVLTYLGRAYYETHRDADAINTLEKALATDKDDHLAHVYLGLIRLRNGEPERGRMEGESGLRGIYESLEYLGSNNFTGVYWDPRREIRSEIERTLGSKPDTAEFVVAAHSIASQFDIELDRAAKDEARSRRGGGGGGE